MLPRILKCFLLALFIALFPSTSSHAQDSLLNHYTDISKIILGQPISKTTSSVFVSKDDRIESGFSELKFTPGTIFKSPVPPAFVSKKLLLKFNVRNGSDSALSAYFFPGFYYDHIQLYWQEGNGLIKIPTMLPQNPDSIGFRKFTLTAGDSATIIAELGLIKTYINTIRPRLVNANQADVFIASFRIDQNQIHIFTYVLCGLLLMMVLYSLANFIQGANREFLYYSGYAFLLGAMLFTKAIFDFHASAISFFLESYLDFMMQCLGILFYMIFMQRFLETKVEHPSLHKLYNIGIVMLAAAMLVFSFLHFFSNNYLLQNMVENGTKILLLIMIIIFLVYSIRHWRDKLLRYLFWGNLLLFVFSMISQMSVMPGVFYRDFPGVFKSALFYYEMGLFLELVLFLAGLNYKNRRQIITQTKEREALKAQNKMQEYETEIAVFKAQQNERERISADMHDELGAGMTAIRLMSEIARNKMKENTPVEIDKISSSANEVLNKMNAIIWSMNSGNDKVDNLISYIRSYAYEYFESTPIECKVNTPTDIPVKELSGDKRRNIFLAVKESLTNVLKHSNASLVTISIETNHKLKIIIADNGNGIDMDNLRQFGNGLKNMARRMESIGGAFHIENNNGTVTTIELPL